MIVSGRHVPAAEAKQLGIVDAVVPGKDLRKEAIAYAKQVAGKLPPPRVRDMTAKLAEAQPGMFDAMRKSIARKARNQKAPYACIDCVEAATTMPFDEGIKFERQKFAELENADEAKALRYAFFAEREVAKLPWLPKDLKLPEIKTMAVVGAGTMGGGIAMSCADFGLPVKLVDANPEVLDAGHGAHPQQLRRQRQARQPLPGGDGQAPGPDRAGRDLRGDRRLRCPDRGGVRADAREEGGVRQARCRHEAGRAALSPTRPPSTSTRSPSVTKRPEAVAGTHFFVPANVMKTFEVVEGAKTSPATLAAAMKLGRDIGKVSAPTPATATASSPTAAASPSTSSRG